MPDRRQKSAALALAVILCACGGSLPPSRSGPTDDGGSPTPTPIPGELHFQPPIDAGAVLPYTLATADFDSDGTGDVVATMGLGLKVFLGSHSGRLRAVEIPPHDLCYNCGIVVGDFNNDGHPDIAAPMYRDAIAIFLGRGDGSFQAPKELLLSDPTTPRATRFDTEALAVGDFDHDGRLDLAVAFDDTVGHKLLPRRRIFLGQGDGTFAPGPLGPQVGVNDLPDHMEALDFDGDGRLDLVVNGENAVYYGRGDGSLDDATQLLSLGPLETTFLATGDFDGDGLPDVALAQSSLSGAGWLFSGTRDRRVAPLTSLAAFAQAIGGLRSGDFDGDGRLDLVAKGNGAPLITIRRGQGDGTFAVDQSFGFVTSVGPVGAFVVTDLNGDGRPDVAVSVGGTADGELWTMLNDTTRR